ncbi:hypothetical protein DPQ25_07980 [Hydrogeniiclostridium mannosilyticum]|uniref:Uncharacterized protein n=1 Tax=Hydrogeniiclostridium mannosilyticum TaxID=2764322 RepID=A0A328UCX3_9FIRM|nr:hypothetical protein DPQ25_07980 [Hydrogeniiclostridium mannosilyticum]
MVHSSLFWAGSGGLTREIAFIIIHGFKRSNYKCIKGPGNFCSWIFCAEGSSLKAGLVRRYRLYLGQTIDAAHACNAGGCG